jgi:hypothetical protein
MYLVRLPAVLILCGFSARLIAQPDPRELVRQSVQNGESAWRQSLEYFCTENDLDREFSSEGTIRNVTDDVYNVIPLGYGDYYEELIRRGKEPVPRAEMVREEAELEKLSKLSPADKQRRFHKLLAERTYMLEVPEAFNYKIVGTENLPTGPAWVLQAVPRPGYVPRSRYAHMFHAMHGKLWIDQKDLQWVKAEAVATADVSFGFFVARLSKGSHISIEQMRLPDGEWVPKRIQARAAARTFLFFNHNFEEEVSYSNYRKSTAPMVTAQR